MTNEQKERLGEALSSGSSEKQARAYAGIGLHEYQDLLLTDKEWIDEMKAEAQAVIAAAKISIRKHIKGTPSFDEAMRFLAIKEPNDWSPKQQIQIETKPLVMLPSRNEEGESPVVLDATVSASGILPEKKE